MSNEKSGASELLKRLEELEARLKKNDERLQKSEQENILLKRQLEKEARAMGNDPVVSAERAKDVLGRSMAEPSGKYRWAVTPPNWLYRDVEFNFDSTDESQAIAEFQRRFKTDFRRDHSENNHKIRLLGKWVNGELVPIGSEVSESTKQLAGAS